MNAGLSKTEGVLHGSFTAERELPAPPGDVFAAYAELPVRRRWFRMPAGNGDNDVAHLKGSTLLQLNGLLAALSA